MQRFSEESIEEIEDLEREIEELERELKSVAERVLEARRSVPDKLEQALCSRLRSLRPAVSSVNLSDLSGTNAATVAAGCPTNDAVVGSSLTEADQGLLEKLGGVRTKTASNIVAMPVILQRMNDSIANLDKLSQHDLNIHFVFSGKEKDDRFIFPCNA